MNEIFEAFLIFFALAAGTFLCGCAPGLVKASPQFMNKMAIFGAGTIIGASLIVVLSEASGILITA